MAAFVALVVTLGQSVRYAASTVGGVAGLASGGAAPVREMYMYRAARVGELDEHRLGDMNLGNVEGVLWYILNEVVTMYTQGVRCPRKYNISVLHRVKVKVRATPELYAQGMTFGTRFAWDRGLCHGRCFSGNKCTSEQDCWDQYAKYGFVPGCNNFRDMYPFPDFNTPAPLGIWYSLPLKGRCDHPTGAHNCTWSYEDAGAITFTDLEALVPGQGNCCNGVCTSFWDEMFSPERNAWRAGVVRTLFNHRYPESSSPSECGGSQAWSKEACTVPEHAFCDFRRDAWYKVDPYPRRDPYAAPKAAPTPATV